MEEREESFLFEWHLYFFERDNRSRGIKTPSVVHQVVKLLAPSLWYRVHRKSKKKEHQILWEEEDPKV